MRNILKDIKELLFVYMLREHSDNDEVLESEIDNWIDEVLNKCMVYKEKGLPKKYLKIVPDKDFGLKYKLDTEINPNFENDLKILKQRGALNSNATIIFENGNSKEQFRSFITLQEYVKLQQQPLYEEITTDI